MNHVVPQRCWFQGDLSHAHDMHFAAAVVHCCNLGILRSVKHVPLTSLESFKVRIQTALNSISSYRVLQPQPLQQLKTMEVGHITHT